MKNEIKEARDQLSCFTFLRGENAMSCRPVGSGKQAISPENGHTLNTWYIHSLGRHFNHEKTVCFWVLSLADLVYLGGLGFFFWFFSSFFQVVLFWANFMGISTGWSLSCHQLPDVWQWFWSTSKNTVRPPSAVNALLPRLLHFSNLCIVGMFAFLAWLMSSRLFFYCFWVPYLSPLPPDTCFFRHSCAAMQEC